MKDFERQIDGPCRKLEAGVWSSLSLFRSWESSIYSFEDKDNHERFCQISLNVIKQNDL